MQNLRKQEDDVKKIIIGILLFVLLLTVLWYKPVNSYAAAYHFAVVNADSLNVRKAPGTDSKVIGKLKENEQVKWSENKNGWKKVHFGEQTGWVSAEYLSDSSITGTNTASTLNIRNTPDGKKIGSIPKGSAVSILGEEAGWYQIRYEGIDGWVSKQYISKVNTNSTNADSGVSYYVNATSLNVRQTASTKSEIITSLKTNTVVKVIETSGSWAKIKSGATTGWVVKAYLSTEQNDAVKEEKIVLLKNANLRKGPGTSYPVVTLAKAGAIYTKVDRQMDWYKLQMADGTHVWVASWLAADPKNDASAVKKSDALKGKTIILDAGHGGRDPGASGLYHKEKTLTLGTTLLAAEMLEAGGAKVILTRNDDVYLSLAKRVEISNSRKADAFVSLHYNAGPKSSKGLITFYHKDKKLAASIQNELVENVGLKNGGTRTNDFYVLKHNNKPSVLVELGFLSNPMEENIISKQAYQQKSARGIYEGLAAYFETNR